MLERLQDFFVSDVAGNVKLKYVGDDIVIMEGISDERIVEETKNEEDSLLSIFHSVHKWNDEEYSGNRLAWVQCLGIPLKAWNEVCFSKLVSEFGKFIFVDKVTASREKIDVARVMVQIATPSTIIFCVNLRINGIICNVRVVEETLQQVESCKCWRWSHNCTQADS